MESKRPKWSILSVLLAQSVFYLLFAVMLDGGLLVNAFQISIIAFWVSVAVLLLRVRGKTTVRDDYYIRYGWVLVMIVGMPAVYYVRVRWMGY